MTTTAEILKELEAMGNPGTKKMLMKNHGVREPCFGVKIGDMKSIVKHVKVDHELALGLYDSGNYDAMYLAGLIADDAKMSKRDLQKWANNARGGSLAGYTVAWTASGGRYGWEMGLKWIESKAEHVAMSGWSTLSCLMALKQDSELDLEKIRALIKHIEETIHQTADLVRYSMNHFLIAVGCGVAPLTKEILATAKRIGPVSANLGNNQCQIPSPIEYIQKVEKRGEIGKKRKKVKC
ncbi:MAG: DNA alkylation repair protein [Verrucomicrobia bacterium]|jgi:3-methyladenine DNA glycosylase AlkD|nr:DNA alkylation repair protein [Verrucomicrobiota bacterium]